MYTDSSLIHKNLFVSPYDISVLVVQFKVSLITYICVIFSIEGSELSKSQNKWTLSKTQEFQLISTKGYKLFL